MFSIHRDLFNHHILSLSQKIREKTQLILQITNPLLQQLKTLLSGHNKITRKTSEITIQNKFSAIALKRVISLPSDQHDQTNRTAAKNYGERRKPKSPHHHDSPGIENDCCNATYPNHRDSDIDDPPVPPF